MLNEGFEKKNVKATTWKASFETLIWFGEASLVDLRATLKCFFYDKKMIKRMLVSNSLVNIRDENGDWCMKIQVVSTEQPHTKKKGSWLPKKFGESKT